MDAAERNLVMRLIDAKIQLALMQRSLVPEGSLEHAEWIVEQLTSELFAPFAHLTDEEVE